MKRFPSASEVLSTLKTAGKAIWGKPGLQEQGKVAAKETKKDTFKLVDTYQNQPLDLVDHYPVLETTFHQESHYDGDGYGEDKGLYVGKMLYPDLSVTQEAWIKHLASIGFKGVMLRDKNKKGEFIPTEVMYSILVDEPEKGTISIYPRYWNRKAIKGTLGYWPMRLIKESAKKAVA